MKYHKTKKISKFNNTIYKQNMKINVRIKNLFNRLKFKIQKIKLRFRNQKNSKKLKNIQIYQKI